ncbi:MAG: TonB-dependent receptor plug domain-containing protein, partial [Anaerovibrio sp.]|nr:TonB-dependent receptor plug domain-containing protein [Anaerovibrio sp.]
MSKWKILSGLVCLSLVTGSAFAAEVTNYGDEEVVVYGDEVTDNHVDTVIDLKDYKGEVKSVPELLRGTAGIQIQEKPVGGAEDQSVKLRGHDSRRFLVLVDGVPQKNSGVMGGSYARKLMSLQETVYGFARRKETIDTAMKNHYISDGTTDLSDGML